MVAGFTLCVSPAKARETVLFEMPNALAMSIMVTYLMAVTIKWTSLFRPMQKYKKGETGEWERLRNLGTVAGTVANKFLRKMVAMGKIKP